MPIRSGAMQRPSGCTCGNTLRQRYDEVGLPCSRTMGSPSPTSTYAISLPRTRSRFFRYGNAGEIMVASRVVADQARVQSKDDENALVFPRPANRAQIATGFAEGKSLGACRFDSLQECRRLPSPEIGQGSRALGCAFDSMRWPTHPRVSRAL